MDIEQKLNTSQVSSSLHMSKLCYDINNCSVIGMGKPHGLSMPLGEAKLAMDAKVFKERQLTNLRQHEIDKAANSDDIDMTGVNVSKEDKRNRVWLVSE